VEEATDKQAPDPEVMCGRCFDEGVEVFPPNCDEKPENLKGVAMGMYHCPDCGAMLIAALPHPALCKPCIDRKHPFHDAETNPFNSL
jgi:hypothetical protein